MLEVKLVRVFKWFENSMLADIDSRKTFTTFKNDANIISNPVYKFKHTEIMIAEGTKEVIKSNRAFRKELKRKLTNSNSVNGLYTNGYKLLYKGKRYRGNYHYNYNIKRFMSGSTLTEKSVKLDKIFKVGESLKNKGRRLNVGGLGNPDPRKPRL